MESYQQQDHQILFKVSGVPNYSLMLKLANQAAPAAHMTTLLFAFDFLKERVGITKLENTEISIHFDEENLTTAEEILQTKMEEVIIKPKGSGDEFDSELADADHIYLNNKEQLIKIVKKETDLGKIKEIHNILTFDVNKLPQAKHNYVGEQSFNDAMANGAIPRAKVAVKDGKSQRKFLQEAAQKQSLVENPYSVFYTAEEVAKHRTDDDCWTIYNGKVFDAVAF